MFSARIRRTLMFLLFAVSLLGAAVIRAQDSTSPTPEAGATIPLPPVLEDLYSRGAWLFVPEVWDVMLTNYNRVNVTWWSVEFGASSAIENYEWTDSDAPQTNDDIIAFFNDDWFDGVYQNSSEWEYVVTACPYDGGVFWEFQDTRSAGEFYNRYWVEPINDHQVYTYSYVYFTNGDRISANAFSLSWKPDSKPCWATAP